MNGYSIGTELKYKIFDNDNFMQKSDIFASYYYSSLSGKGVDDDIRNYYGIISFHKAKGTSHDIRLGTNLSIGTYENITPYIRLGGFYKKIRFDMNLNEAISYYGYYDSFYKGKFSTVSQRSDSVFTGVTAGTKISYESDKTTNSLIADFYPAVYYTGKQHWPLREPENQYWQLKQGRPGIGFKVTLENYLTENFKLFSSYEYIEIHRLNEFVSNYSYKGGTDSSFAKGKASFNSLNMGMGLYF